MELQFKDQKAVIKGATYRLYRKTFGKDLILLYEDKRSELINKISANEMTDTPAEIMKLLGTDFLETLAYACLKTANPELPLFEEYVNEHDDYQGLITFGLSCFEAIFFASIPVEPATEEAAAAKPKKKKG